MSKHTPGPWRVVESKYVDKTSCLYVMAGDYADEGEPDMKVEVISSVAQCDASLIAAAPELLEACRRADRVIENAYNKMFGALDLTRAAGRDLEYIRAAIKKAEGVE